MLNAITQEKNHERERDEGQSQDLEEPKEGTYRLDTLFYC